MHGSTQEQHDARFNDVLRRLSGAGLTLNAVKCEFTRPELDFYGLHFSGESNMADYPLRNPIRSISASQTDDPEAYVNMICDTAMPSNISQAQLVLDTPEDTSLGEVKVQSLRLPCRRPTLCIDDLRGAHMRP